VADVAGYSRLMGQDEAGTLARLKMLRRELIDPAVVDHGGRIVKTTGDGVLVEFPSVVEAVACAVAVQRGMVERNASIPDDRRIEFRVGINTGDVIVEDGDIHGDGVNVAARLEALAEPGGICVSAVVWDQVQGRLDCGFDDLGEQNLKNIARPLRIYRVQLDTAPSVRPRTLPLPDKPSIAVLPFQNMSGDPDQEYFADGMVEEIITALSRIRQLFVIARNSTFTYKGHAFDVKQVGRELGVRYALEGSVRKAGDRLRITAQLIEAETGAHLWADRFDGSLEDVFDLQDKVAANVAGIIEPALQAAEIARSARRPTADLTAYDLYLRAYAIVLSAPRCIPDALFLLEQAIERDPDYGPALAWAAFCQCRLVLDGRSEDPVADRRKGSGFAERALQVAGDDSGVLANAAWALAYCGEDIVTMMRLVDRALMLNPNHARGWHISGVLRMWAGHLDDGIERVERSLRLSPRSRVASAAFVKGYAYFASHCFDEAVAQLLMAIHEAQDAPHPYRVLAACYAHMGRFADAREIVRRLRAITAVVLDDAHYLRNREHREFFLAGLRLAMGGTE
jgi:adenylate cyclase